jgi:hypothetical protein
LQPYQGEKHLLYISKDKDLADFYLEEAKPQNWPKGMPKLKELIGTSLDTELDLTPEQVALLLPYFNQLPGFALFTQNEEEYFVVLRPVLPGEDKTLNFYEQSEASAFGLPFTCET